MYRFASLCALLASVCVADQSFAATLDATSAESSALAGTEMRTTISEPSSGDQLAMTLPPLAQLDETVLSSGPSNRAALGPKVLVRVDISEQTMVVLVEGKVAHVWPVSTARRGYSTPTGFWTPYRMHVMWHSRKYDNAPMPHSIFFNEGYAIHATPHVKRLGTPASHGCVRLHPDNATTLFSLAKSYGRGAMRVEITQ